MKVRYGDLEIELIGELPTREDIMGRKDLNQQVAITNLANGKRIQYKNFVGGEADLYEALRELLYFGREFGSRSFEDYYNTVCCGHGDIEEEKLSWEYYAQLKLLLDYLDIENEEDIGPSLCGFAISYAIESIEDHTFDQKFFGQE
jgi:hypothetical protein